MTYSDLSLSGASPGQTFSRRGCLLQFRTPCRCGCAGADGSSASPTLRLERCAKVSHRSIQKARLYPVFSSNSIRTVNLSVRRVLGTHIVARRPRNHPHQPYQNSNKILVSGTDRCGAIVSALGLLCRRPPPAGLLRSSGHAGPTSATNPAGHPPLPSASRAKNLFLRAVADCRRSGVKFRFGCERVVKWKFLTSGIDARRQLAKVSLSKPMASGRTSSGLANSFVGTVVQIFQSTYRQLRSLTLSLNLVHVRSKGTANEPIHHHHMDYLHAMVELSCRSVHSPIFVNLDVFHMHWRNLISQQLHLSP
ncbi:hypothetical protein VTK26DRAFT_6129 [Humicola hyalothermophila]